MATTQKRWNEKINNLKYDPANVIFAFDLHDVVLELDMIGMMKTLFTTWEGLKFVLAISIMNPIVSIFLVYIFAKRMLQKFWTKPDLNAIVAQNESISNDNHVSNGNGTEEAQSLLDSHENTTPREQSKHRWNFLMGGTLSNLESDVPSVVVEQIWFELVVAKFPSLQPHNNFFIKLANTFSLKPETASLMKKLKQKGYKVYLFRYDNTLYFSSSSNIGDRFWADMQTKFPEVFSLLDGVQVATVADNYLAKPQPSSFRKFLSTFNKDDCHVIFVDDSVTNLSVAELVSNKFVSYRYTSGKKLLEDFTVFVQ